MTAPRQRLLVCFIAMCCSAVVAAPVPKGADAAHRRGICGEIVKLDLLLYDDPHVHAPTATCSYTDDRLLVKPRRELPTDRMKRFVFLAFLVAGKLRNDDFMMPPVVYAGYGSTCQSLTLDQAALLQRDARSGGESGMFRSYSVASGAPKVACPK